MHAPKRNYVLGEISARWRQQQKRTPIWESLKTIRIPRGIWGGLLLILCSVLAGWLIRIGYAQDWTGWKSKTLWDWMDLLLVPLSLALVAYLFSRHERKTDRAIAAEQHQQRLLQDYLDRISKLAFDNAKEIQTRSTIAVLAQALTLTVLRQSDTASKSIVLRFLNDAKLIQSGRNVVDLNGAELSEIVMAGVNLEEVDLSGAILKKCDLRNSILRKANLDRAILNGSKLDHTDLSEAQLSSAKLIRCSLTGAHLASATLEGTDLTASDLSKAHLQGAYLGGAKYDRTVLKKIVYDDKTTWPSSNFSPPADAVHNLAWLRDRPQEM